MARSESNLDADQKLSLLILRTSILPQLLLRTKKKKEVADPTNNVANRGVVMRKMARFMSGGFQGLHDRFDGLEDHLERLLLSLDISPLNPEIGLERVLAWLNSVFTDEEWETNLKLRTRETWKWVVQRPQFRNWASSTTAGDTMRILWVHGAPGFGKTSDANRRNQTNPEIGLV